MSVLQSGGDAGHILRALNDKQREVVETIEGAVLVVAGPGSGKTRALTSRIAYLIANGIAWPSEILALTFTNKAAREMRHRVYELLPEGAADGLFMGTFHSVMCRVLRMELRHGWLKGYTHEFSVYDTDDSERVIRQLMEERNIDKKEIAPRTVRSAISRAKNQMLSPSQFEQQQRTPRGRRIASLLGPYQRALHASNALDFDDLLLKPMELFRKHLQVLEKYQKRWRFVHIDEYQDTNRIQYLLSRSIAGFHGNICVVGDDAQSIYSFRGADLRNILDFESDYRDAKIIRLEQNYRSTPEVLKAAGSVIGNNTGQITKTLWTSNAGGDKVMLLQARNERVEARKVVDRIRDYRERHGYSYNDFGILYRTNAQSRNFEDELRKEGLPYRVVGGMSFYQRKEIKDAVSYLRLLVNQEDQAGLFRIINYPSRKIGLKTQERLRDYMRFNGIGPWAALEQCDKIGAGGVAVNALSKFKGLIARYRARLKDEMPDDVARELLKEAGLFHHLDKDGSESGVARVQNVQELISAIAQHILEDPEGTLSTFLQSISLLTDADEGDDQQDTVTLMTLHASKGLEFKVVFIGGVEEGLLPLSRALEEPDGIEEERRLFYVGITRAEKHLYISHATSRFQFGRTVDSGPSSFIEEIDSSVVQRERISPYNRMRRPQVTSRVPTQRPGSFSTRQPAVSATRLGQRDIDGIKPGMRVAHTHFGEGRVLSVSGWGPQKTALVDFDESGHKRMMLRFARLRVV